MLLKKLLDNLYKWRREFSKRKSFRFAFDYLEPRLPVPAHGFTWQSSAVCPLALKEQTTSTLLTLLPALPLGKEVYVCPACSPDVFKMWDYKFLTDLNWDRGEVRAAVWDVCARRKSSTDLLGAEMVFKWNPFELQAIMQSKVKSTKLCLYSLCSERLACYGKVWPTRFNSTHTLYFKV